MVNIDGSSISLQEAINSGKLGDDEKPLNEYSAVIGSSDVTYISCGEGESPVSYGTNKNTNSAYEDSTGCQLDLANKRCKIWRDSNQGDDLLTGYCYCK